MKLAGLFGLLFIFSSCIKNNPNPAWLEIDAWTLEANILLAGNEGELNHNLSDAYVSVGGKIMGIFELPCKIPVLMEGEQTIEIYPVVRKNGIAATKGVYPFCTPHVLKPILVKNETIKILPKTHYATNVKFTFFENFENNDIQLTTDPTSKANLERVQHTDPGKTGNCGRVHFTSSDSVWTAYTNGNTYLPKGGREVYLEIDYKLTNNLLTGVLGISQSSTKVNPNIQLNAQDPASAVWKKTYIELKEIVSSSTTAEYFKQYLQAVIDPGKTSSDIYIDNIKVIHFE